LKPMISAQYVIIGAGFAGAATAYFLARSGAQETVLVEQEDMAGVHSSGRNASMIRQVVSSRALAALAKEGAAFLRNPPPDWPHPGILQQNGSLLLACDDGWKRLLRDAEVAREIGIETESWSPEKAEERVAILEDAVFDGAIWSPADGVVDIHALLTAYLKVAKAHGARTLYSSAVRQIDVRDGRVNGVVTEGEVIKTEAVINAAGPWAGTIGKLAGALDVPLRPCRRHLFLTAPLSWVDPSWPFVWDVTHDFYFRPESGGLLLCPCDQDEMVPTGIPPTDNSVTEQLAEKIRGHFPRLSDVAIRKSWAGFRTLSPDGHFVLGWDPKIRGFFWVAGLGGHGVTTSPAIGALAAKLILNPGEEAAKEFSPDRFLA